ncbi:hypothetical protein ACJIZ3_004558 [Penstemon smallii]|uniref:Peptidase metallopeptidase domain-containing protein n=1 Tax=Penstemon smallii TaxID=265156 RepID=A0ABD3S2M6_9LAMI
MQEPRCGVPDFFHSNKIIPIHMTSHYSFFSGRPKWHKRKLKYSFNRNVKEDVKPHLESALKEWASKTRFEFTRVANLRLADIGMSFMPKRTHGDGFPFDKNELGHAFAPPNGSVHLNADKNWSRNGFDIQSVGLHELGHALGLGHSRNKKAIMYPIIFPGEIKHLDEDDINGIRTLYNFRGRPH